MTRMPVLRRIILLAVVQCAVLGSMTAPAVVGISVIVRRMVGAEAAPAALAMISAVGAATAMVANPLFGWLADRTRSRLGRRRPWLIGGGIGGLLGTAVMAWSPDVVTLAVAWLLTQAAYNACYGAINGLVSQGLPPEERTRAGGLFSAAGFLGTLPGLAMAAIFPTDIVPMLLTVPAIAAIVIIVIAVRIDDPPRPATLPRSGWARSGIAPLMTGPFIAAFATRFIIVVEMTAGLAFALYLFMDRWGMAEDVGVQLTSLSTLFGAAAVVAASLAIASTPARRIAPRTLLVASLMLLLVGMLGRGFAPTPWAFLAASLIAGIGIGTGMTSTRALAQGALPPHDSALGLGVFNIANTAGPIFAPLLAAWLLERADVLGFPDAYTGMYVLLAVPVVIVAGLIPLLPKTRRGDLVAAA